MEDVVFVLKVQLGRGWGVCETDGLWASPACAGGFLEKQPSGTRSSAKSLAKYPSEPCVNLLFLSAGGNKLGFSLMRLQLRFLAMRVWGDHVWSQVNDSQI